MTNTTRTTSASAGMRSVAQRPHRSGRAARRPPRPVHAALVLAARETILLVRHPLHLVAVVLVGISVFTVPAQTDDRSAYFEIGVDIVTWYGILTYFATYLCATRAARAGDGPEWLEATPASRAARTTAMCLATLGPFLIACLLAAVLDPVVGARAARSADPGGLRLAGATVCVLGAGLLAVAVSRWLRFPGAAVVVLVAIVAASVWVDAHGQTLLQPQIDWALWNSPTAHQPFSGVIAGSPGWHPVYLSGWVMLAGCAALLADRRRGRVAILAIAAIAVAATVLAASAQLP